jgi:hypothetical protein
MRTVRTTILAWTASHAASAERDPWPAILPGQIVVDIRGYL